MTNDTSRFIKLLQRIAVASGRWESHIAALSSLSQSYSLSTPRPRGAGTLRAAPLRRLSAYLLPALVMLALAAALLWLQPAYFALAQTANPDLVVGAPTVSDDSLGAGASFTLKARVRNQGDGPSDSTALRYYRSADATISTDDTKVGVGSVSGLDASITSDVAIELTAPSSADSYYYGACVVPVAGESDTGNNCSDGVKVTVAVSERAALVALYNAAGGASWTNNRNWLSNAPIDQWTGVGTDANGSVVELNLHENRLSGEIPSELGSLSNLKILLLGHNRLSGEIPAELGDLASLTLLYLGHNQLSGDIPTELGSLSNLIVLHLHDNQLSDKIPTKLGSLANLKWLHLGSNQLSGEIPTELGSLSNLTHLYLNTNRLSGEIPTELGDLTNLTRLYLGSNRLSEEIPAELSSLTNLNSLYLSDNRLSGEIPAELGDLTNLTRLYLSGNQLSGCMPDGLRDVASNDLGGLGLSFCAPDLVVGPPTVSDDSLDAGSSFTLEASVRNQGDGPSDSTALRYYRSADATISTDDTEVGTGQVSGLAVSEASEGSIELTAPSSAGSYYYGACVAQVDGESDAGNNCSNGVMVTVVMSERAALVVLYNATGGANWRNNRNWLSNAPIDQWSGVVTDAEGRVVGLHLFDNQMSGEIPAELSNLSNLTDLYLQVNQLSGEIPSELGSLSSLTSLRLGSNQLSGEIPSELGSLSSLTSLHLNHNQLSGEIPAELGSLTNLTRLGLNHNQLSGEIPAELGSLTNLTRLGLNHNQLSGEIPAELGSLTNLDGLHLGHNHLSGEIPYQLGSLSNLRVLHLNGNQLSGEIPYHLGNLSNLTHLNLSANLLSGCVIKGLRGVPNSDLADLNLPFCAPDLRVDQPTMFIDKSLDAGESFTLKATVRNVGDGPSGSTTLRYYRSPNAVIIIGDATEVGARSVSGLDASITSDVSIELTAPSSAGIYYYGACVAPVVGESYTEHSCAFAWLRVTVAVSDRATLVALYNATGGANWTNNRNWLSNAPIDQWYGVVTDANGRVVELRLYDNGLSGEIPSRLGSLTNLTRLFLGSNQLSGEIPYHLGSLTNLTDLYLYGNQLSGEIPHQLGSLTNLNSLDLAGNRLSGEIPTELGSLANLKWMGLGSNRLSGEIPTELGSLSNLTVLHLGSNRLSEEIPTELGSLANLDWLNLGNNRLIGKIPTELGTLTNLNSLYLSGNQLSGCVPDGLSAVPSNDLGDLDLSFCAPDLVVGPPTVSDDSLDAGASFTLKASVRNQGDGPSGSTTLSYYRSADATISTDDTEVGTGQVSGLAVSEASEGSLELTAPSSAGSYYYGACVASVAGESDAGNNCSNGVMVIVTQ